MNLSIIIPAHNEEGCLEETVSSIIKELDAENINFDILVINDNSADGTKSVCEKIKNKQQNFSYINRTSNPGFGIAVREGLAAFKGDVVAIVMADGSDSPLDIVACYRKIEEGYECAFGSRFIKGSNIKDYPYLKLFINRIANKFIQALFNIPYNDVTNAFKIYRREVIEHAYPLLSVHFNLTVEIPLKAIIRGFTYAVVPISWINRKKGTSNLAMKEMGSRYLFIVLYLFLEKILSKGDYLRKN